MLKPLRDSCSVGGYVEHDIQSHLGARSYESLESDELVVLTPISIIVFHLH